MPDRPLKQILYIEDDEGLARLLQKRMERSGYTIDIAFSGEEGLAKAAAAKYDLLLVDYHLPDTSGMELLEKFKSMEPPTPVIILTASGDERLAVAALEKGAADYAVKDTAQTYIDLMPAIMQAAYTKERLLRITEQQQHELINAKQKAETANQAKTSFLTTMSHEMRTPLNVVIGIAQLLSAAKLPPKETKMVETLLSNADLLLKLINDLLDLSRIESGHIELEEHTFSLWQLLEDIRLMFDTQASQKGLALVVENPSQDFSVKGDRTRVQQIVMNLVSNAIKFTKQGEVRVSLRTRETGANVACTIEVSDTGIGIPLEKQATIFDKFTQADETITRRFGGSGLGLSIARSLAKLMHGDIALTSEAEKGSLFTITLLLPKAALPDTIIPVQTVSTTPASEEGYKGKILIVEDYFPNIMVATMMLENLGFEVATAESGAEAIAAIDANPVRFQAILMDVQMQDMDGLETTRRIREKEAGGPAHYIIGVTAHALAGDRERCIAAGMDDYISKPINPDILSTKLRTLCSNPPKAA